MKQLTMDDIRRLGISPTVCVEWIRESFLAKKQATLPPKISLHPQGSDFFNTMPCLLPPAYQRFGLKVVSRIEGATPSLRSDILLYDSTTGDLLAMLDGDWITTMRTGAVATLAAQTFRNQSTEPAYGLFGLGNTARAFLLCLLETEPDRQHRVILLRYKDQAEQFIRRFEAYPNVVFDVCPSAEEIVHRSSVIVSCVTEAKDLFCPDDTVFQPGCTVIPVHSRGFQNCDLFFDKVFGDDRGHVDGFRYFSQFRSFAEFSDVLDGTKPGRESDDERILCYNIGLGLHDVLFADKIFKMAGAQARDISVERVKEKFWI